MFVDIKPSAVPGPLASEVQGIRLEDPPDLTRAIARLQRHFDIVAEAELTEDEWASLEAAVHAVAVLAEEQRGADLGREEAATAPEASGGA